MKRTVGGKYLHRIKTMEDALDDQVPLVEVQRIDVAKNIGMMREPMAWRIDEHSREEVMKLLGISLFEFCERYK